MTSPAVEKFDAITNSNVPTISVGGQGQGPVVRANPYLKPAIASVARVNAGRPSFLGDALQTRPSKVIYQGINQILNGTAGEETSCRGVQSKLNQILKQKVGL